MTGRVEQDIPDRIPDFTRCLQHPHVVPIRQQPTVPSERAPHRPDHPPAERLHPTTESMAVLRLGRCEFIGFIAVYAIVNLPVTLVWAFGFSRLTTAGSAPTSDLLAELISCG